MDRQIVYAGQIPRSLDFAQMQQSAMIALGWLGLGVFGEAAVVVGLGVAPTSPASLAVVVAPGLVSSYTSVEATAFGTSLPADLADPLLKMGIVLTPTTLGFAAPTTPGQSQSFAIYAEFSEIDTTPVVLPFLDTADTASQYAGQGGNNEPLNTQRLQGVTIGAVTGAPANVGAQLVPAIPQGAVPLCNLTLTYGQTQITAASLVVAPGNPTIPYTLPEIPEYFQLKLGYVPANAAGDVPGGSLTFPGAGRVVTVGTGGSGRVVANALALGTAAAAGSLVLVGGLTVNGGTALTGSLGVSGNASVVNATANLLDATGNSTMQVGSSSGGDVCIGFNSANQYGLKMGITGPEYAGGAGVWMLGGWSDGAQYRIAIDRSGNASLRGGLNASTLLAVNGLYSQSWVKGADRPVIFRDESGQITGSVTQSGTNGSLYLSANGGNGNPATVDQAGNVNAVGRVAAGADLTAQGNVVVQGQVKGAGGVFSGGTITLGGAPGVAGQVSYAADGSKTTLFCGLGGLSVDRSGKAYTNYNQQATGDTNVVTGLAIGQVLTSTTSDIALKTNLDPHLDALTAVRALGVWEFNYVEGNGFDPAERHVGFIAQDVEKHMPQAYGEVAGVPSVFLHKMVPSLARAQQQLADENDALRAAVADMTTRLAAIETAPRA